jgi:hypothetical protein
MAAPLPPAPRDDATPDRRPGRELALGALALLLYTALGVALLHDTLWGDQVLSASGTAVVLGPFPDSLREGLTSDGTRFSDNYRQFEPWARFAAEVWAETGELPLWKDHTLLGAPLLGNGQSALLYPPNLVSMLLGAPPASHGWRALFRLVVGALSTWMLARHLRCGLGASLVAGLTFGFFGFGVVFLLWPHTNVSCLLPLLVWAALRAVDAPRGGRLVTLAAVCALQHLGGHPETAMLSQLVAFALCAAHAGTLGAGVAVRRLLPVAGGFVLGALLAGPQLVPLVEYLLHSDALASRSAELAGGEPGSPAVWAGFGACALLAFHAGRQFTQPGRAVLPWLLLLTAALLVGARVAMEVRALTDVTSLLVADWLGGPQRLRVPQNYIEGAAVYAGPGLALALLGVLTGAPRRVARTWVWVLLLALLVRGRAPGLHELVESLPVVGLMPSSRAALVAQLAVAVLAALGYDAVRRPLGDPRLRTRYLALLLALVVAAAGSLVWATADGVVGAGNVPAPSRELIPPLRVDLAPVDALGDGPALYRGTFDAPREVAAVRVHWSRRGQPVAARFWRQHAPGPVGQGRYNFEVELPGERMPAITAMLRVDVDLTDGTLFSSPGLHPDAGLAAILASVPVVPRDAQATPQFLLLLGLGLVTALSLGRPRAPRGPLLLLVLAGVPVFAPEQLPRTPRDRFWPPSPALEFLADVAPDGRVLTAKSSWMAGVLGGYRVPQVLGYDALVPIHTAALLRAAVAPGSEGVLFRDLPRGFQADPRLVDLLAASASLGPASDFRVFFYDGYERGQRLEVFVNDSPLPRARLVSAARVVPDDADALALLQDPAFDPVRELVLADGEPLDGGAGPSDPGSATLVESLPDRVLVDVVPAGPAYLLLADSWFPGWEARVDGRPRPIHRADLALRAVRVEPGDRRVEFRYAPGSWRLGLTLGALGLGGCALLLLRRRV